MGLPEGVRRNRTLSRHAPRRQGLDCKSCEAWHRRNGAEGLRLAQRKAAQGTATPRSPPGDAERAIRHRKPDHARDSRPRSRLQDPVQREVLGPEQSKLLLPPPGSALTFYFTFMSMSVFQANEELWAVKPRTLTAARDTARKSRTGSRTGRARRRARSQRVSGQREDGGGRRV